MLERVWRNRTLLHCWWECKLVQSLWRTVWRFCKKLGTELPYDPEIPLLNLYTEETKTERDMSPYIFITEYHSIVWMYHSVFIDSSAERLASLVSQIVKNPPAIQETHVWALGWEDPLEKGMTTYSSILVWRIPWTEDPRGLQSIWLRRVRHNGSDLALLKDIFIAFSFWIKLL